MILRGVRHRLSVNGRGEATTVSKEVRVNFSTLSVALISIIIFLPVLFLRIFITSVLGRFSMIIVASALADLLMNFALAP